MKILNKEYNKEILFQLLFMSCFTATLFLIGVLLGQTKKIVMETPKLGAFLIILIFGAIISLFMVTHITNRINNLKIDQLLKKGIKWKQS